jgi:hypothetical protein
MQAMADDSGCKGQGRVIVMAGLIGPSEWWADFSDNWDACLKEDPAIGYFKMREAAHLSGEFAGFKAEQRNAKLIALVRVLNGHPFSCLHITVNLAAHEWMFGQKSKTKEGGKKKKQTAMEPKTEAVARNAYWYVYNTFISSACAHLWEQGERERFDFIVDKHPSLGPRTKLWYPAVRASMSEPRQSIMPVEPIPQDDLDFMPLQAADLIAWLQRAANTPKGHEFGWLSEHFTTVTASPFCRYMDRGWFANLLMLTHALETNGALPIEAMIELARLQGAQIGEPKQGKP